MLGEHVSLSVNGVKVEGETNQSNGRSNTPNRRQPANIRRFCRSHAHLHHLLHYIVTIPAQGADSWLLVANQAPKNMNFPRLSLSADSFESRFDKNLSAFCGPLSAL